MHMCRVCLSSETLLQPLDATFVINYNLLTNLNITLLDGMPQFSCSTCLNTVKYFIEFRKRSIASETTLREIMCAGLKSEPKKIEFDLDLDSEPGNIQNLVGEEIQDDNLNTIKNEIKIENVGESDTGLDNFDVTFEEYEVDIKNLVKDEDVKPKKVGKRKNKKITTKLKASKNVVTKLRVHKLIENILENNKFLCGICPKSFDEKNDLLKHLEIHNNDKQCDICKERVTCLSELLAHRLKHLPPNQNKCHICDKRYRSCLYLEHHYRVMHIKTDDPKISCKICLSKFSNPKRLNCHRLQTHSNIQFYCDYCSKCFGSKCTLKSHIKQHIDLKAYVCDQCGFSCKYSGGLKDHKIRRHSQEKIYCKNCTRPFSSQQDYDRHKCKKKLIICIICGIQLSGSSRLSSHMNRHSDVAKFECKRCPAKFKTREALKVHNNRHDGNRTQQCPYCPAKFYSATVLLKHRRTHTGEKPYVCKVCNKGFTGNHNLKVHMKVHGEYLIIKKNTEPDSNNVTK